MVDLRGTPLATLNLRTPWEWTPGGSLSTQTATHLLRKGSHLKLTVASTSFGKRGAFSAPIATKGVKVLYDTKG